MLILLLLPLLLLLLLGVLDESPGPPSLFFRRERMRARWSPCDEVGVAVAVAVAVATKRGAEVMVDGVGVERGRTLTLPLRCTWTAWVWSRGFMATGTCGGMRSCRRVGCVHQWRVLQSKSQKCFQIGLINENQFYIVSPSF